VRKGLPKGKHRKSRSSRMAPIFRGRNPIGVLVEGKKGKGLSVMHGTSLKKEANLGKRL